MPARKSSESPGKKKPTSSPVSANRISKIPIDTEFADELFGVDGIELATR